jgi:hypothetical protein
MRLQRLAAFIERNGIFQVHFALLQPGDDGFQFLERGFEAEFLDGLAFLGGGNGGYST